MPSPFELITPLDGSPLIFQRMNGHEELGRLSRFSVQAASERDNLDPDLILGRTATLRMTLPNGGHRWFNGHVASFGQAGFHGRNCVYRMVLRPWLWFLTRATNCRVFQKMPVPDILKQVFDGYPDVANVAFELTADYPAWDYCVQYRETDFDFVSRLMEREGIYYYFRHEEDRHELVLVDASSAHSTNPDCEELPFVNWGSNARASEAHVDQWRFERQVMPVRYAHDNYDPEKPGVELQRSSSIEREHAHAHYEVYDYPGPHTSVDDGDRYARLRIEELQARHEAISARTNAHSLSTGNLFTLTRHPNDAQNREYLVVSTHYDLTADGFKSSDSDTPAYTCKFAALPTSHPFRTARTTPKPVVQGPQTAVVVGPAGEEIHTDDHGRVKVKFHWDRYSPDDGSSSCWIRVSQPWAGKGWGAVSIPRIGQEVVVDFLEGDPDRPLITGRVYNAEQMPPFAMPGTVSGLKSQTHKGSGHNELSMNDTAGQEMFNLRAQHDMATNVGNNQTTNVKCNRTSTVDADDALTVKANRTLQVKGKLVESVDTGHERTIKAGYTETITEGAKSTITDGFTRTINGRFEHTVNGSTNWTFTEGLIQTITSGKTLTVNSGGFSENVTGRRSMVVTGPFTKYATETVGIHSDGNGTYTSGATLTLGVEGSAIQIDKGSITITAGNSTIKIDSTGVAVNGVQISLNC